MRRSCERSCCNYYAEKTKICLFCNQSFEYQCDLAFKFKFRVSVCRTRRIADKNIQEKI